MLKLSFETIADILWVKDSTACLCLRSLASQGSSLVWPREASVFFSAGAGAAF